jgi:hypothetical protein
VGEVRERFLAQAGAIALRSHEVTHQSLAWSDRLAFGHPLTLKPFRF